MCARCGEDLAIVHTAGYDSSPTGDVASRRRRKACPGEHATLSARRSSEVHREQSARWAVIVIGTSCVACDREPGLSIRPRAPHLAMRRRCPGTRTRYLQHTHGRNFASTSAIPDPPSRKCHPRAARRRRQGPKPRVRAGGAKRRGLVRRRAQLHAGHRDGGLASPRSIHANRSR
jgi:hypothetical protein